MRSQLKTGHTFRIQNFTLPIFSLILFELKYPLYPSLSNFFSKLQPHVVTYLQPQKEEGEEMNKIFQQGAEG